LRAEDIRITVLVSRSLGPAQLKEIFAFAADTPRVRVAFRGLAEDESLMDFVRQVHGLLAGIEPVPEVVLDPKPFAAAKMDISTPSSRRSCRRRPDGWRRSSARRRPIRSSPSTAGRPSSAATCRRAPSSSGDCFGRVDWDRVNLDEWLAILAETGHFPTLDSLNLDALTGTGSELDVSGNRPDAAARSQIRSDGLDSDAARWQAETELWESTLPALP
jgi:hypothetical protein